MTAIRGLTFLLPVCLTLFFVDLNGLDLWSSHEARAAQNAQRMLDDRDWLLPRLYDGQPDFQKPPAFYWLVAGIGSCRNDTVDRWAVRLPSAIAALATVLMVWLRLVRHGRPLAGLIAGLILATSVHFTALARTGRIDMPLTATVTAAILMLSTTGPRFIATLGAGFALAGAILLKGPIGVVLALGVVSLTLIARRIRGERLEIRMILPPLGAMLLGSLIALPWFHEVNERTSGEFMRIFFWHHNVERALGNAPSLATHPWWYYLPRFGVDFLPWTPMLLAAMYLTVRGKRNDPEAAFGLLWLLVMVGLLSLARFKRADYLLPAFPGAALFVGCVVERAYQRIGTRWQKPCAVGFLMIASGCVAGWEYFHRHVEPRHQAEREQKAFADFIREKVPVPRTVLLFRVESHLLAYHLGRPIHTLVEWGELNQRLGEPGPHYFVTREEFVAECQTNVLVRRLEVAARSADFAPVTPQRPLVLMRSIDQ